MSKDRTTVSFEDGAETNAYLERVRRAKSRGVPLGGAEPVQGLPNLAQAVEEARTGRGLPEQQATYTPEQYSELVKRGMVPQGIGGAYPAVQRASGVEAPAPGRLSKATVEGLNALAGANVGENPPKQDATAPEKAGEKPADAEGPAPAEKMDVDTLRLLLGQRTDYLQRKSRREAIEGRCAPIKLRQVIIDNGAQQRVKIVPDELEVTFRSLNGHEDRFAKHQAWELCHGQDVSQVVYDTLLSLTNLALSVVAINDLQMPEHRLPSGEVDAKIFDKKFNDLMQRPFALLQDLFTNFSWFDDRIRQLLDVESLGNG